MFDAHAVLQVLYFFVPAYLANKSPVLVSRRFSALAVPIDRRWTLWGKRIHRDHKTWRGLLAGIITGTVAYELQGLTYAAGFARDLALIDHTTHPLFPSLLLGFGTGVGDAVKSFFKRRIDIAPGKSWFVFDQLDFVVGAYVFVSVVSVPPLLPTLASLPLILLGNVAITVLGYWLGLKEMWI